MEIRKIDEELSVTGQLSEADLEQIAGRGFRSIICNRPDNEEENQPGFGSIEEAAEVLGLSALYLPVVAKEITEVDVLSFTEALAKLPKPILSYCRTGSRCSQLWALYAARKAIPMENIRSIVEGAGFNLDAVEQFFAQHSASRSSPNRHFEVLIVGAGAGGLSTAASLLKRQGRLEIGIIDPAEKHYYQPGWTMVGAGVFDAPSTERHMAKLIPSDATWIKAAVIGFDPNNNQVALDNGTRISYDRLVVAAGLVLNWHGVEGLAESLGTNGVTSNYRYDLAPYTWRLVQDLRKGKAIFTQPPMPIKCAGAPQKAMYLSSDHWRRTNRLRNIEVHFYNAGGVIFGVQAYVPALEKYLANYAINLHFSHNLVKIDGESKTAWFEKQDSLGNRESVSTNFDMIHVCPPQQAPDFIRSSSLVDDGGWVDVDKETLAHKKYSNIWALGDVINAPNAKTAAAARMQAPIVAHNVLSDIGSVRGIARYNGYGSCPLTVAKGKIVLAEFGYDGKLLPSFPKWLIDGTKPSRAAWVLKKDILPLLYWHGMLKGREWKVKPVVAEMGTDHV